MAKEAPNRKRSIFCEPLEKELNKRLVKCFAWSIALGYMLQRLGDYDGMSKKGWKYLKCGYGERWSVFKWIDKIKKAGVLERVGEGRIMLELIKERKRNWLGH